jgi:hypothetical protein
MVRDWSLKSSVEPFVSAVRPFVEPVYEFDLCKGPLADYTGGSRCSVKAWRNAKEDAKNIAMIKKHNAHLVTQDFEYHIADHKKSAQDGVYEEQMSLGKHLTTTRAYPQQSFTVVHIAEPRDEDRDRVALGLAYFAMAASNEEATAVQRNRARLEMENAIAAISKSKRSGR